MQLYSTKSPKQLVDLKKAVLQGLPEDNGLYMPKELPRLEPSFLENLSSYTFPEIAFEVSKTLMQSAVPDADLREIVEKAIDFPAPVVTLDPQTHILELFHGPSLAFKDFGARFMARLMSYFNQDAQKELLILVATSGDTGGAVASGFYKTPGIQVVILYPSGKVSPLQEKQLTTLGHNITALEIDGTFDDCQALVKQAFLDQELQAQIRLTSANSINISRLIPQSFYYFEAYKQLKDKNKEVVFSIPSGNFGNLTAGLLAQRMGLNVKAFIAATNINDVVPVYLSSGEYLPRPSVRTISNAMDVGNPSNFARMLDLYCSTWNIMRENVFGYSFNDQETRKCLKEVYDKHQYVMDPHGAVGYLALEAYKKDHPEVQGIVLETAHPSKFIDDVEDILSTSISIPERLAKLADEQKVSIEMKKDFSDFKNWLLANY
ncbi:MAG: threonine synthase [Bacteroidota bacterium]